MPLDYSFEFPLANGLHARPASHLQELSNQFRSNVLLINLRSGREADGKSVLSLVGADVKMADPCKLVFEGDDSEAARIALSHYIEGDFLKCDEVLPQVETVAGEVVLPRVLRKAGLEKFYSGLILSRGIGWGRVVVVGGLNLPTAMQTQQAGSQQEEWGAASLSMTSLQEQLRQRIGKTIQKQEVEVLKAHLAIVQDRAFAAEIERLILGGDMNAGQAIVAASEHFSSTLLNSENAYLRERVLDIQDVCGQLLSVIYGADAVTKKIVLDRASVCVAENLTPGQFLALDRTHLKALVLGHAGTTSHTVILARSFGIPTLAGLSDAHRIFRDGQEVIVDTHLGIVIPEVTEPIARYYRREERKAMLLSEKLAIFQQREARTLDGRRIEVAANVASAEEAVHAFDSGAEGIGLFRTEMLFMDRESAPDEDEQTAIYSAAVKAGRGRPVIIRTLDIGGDKPVSYLGLPTEFNPFLGYRGVRIYNEFSELIIVQFRALLRAAEHGALRVMIPMVSSVEEVRCVKGWLAEAREQLRALGVAAADANFELGIMLEVPSVAYQMPQLCAEVDFFSIGTNDLTQYFLAADRDNAKVASIYSATHPSFLRLLKTLIEAAHLGDRWIGLCGEMGENRQLLPLLIGLGIDEVSLAGPRVAATKAAICELEFSRCQELVEQVLTSTVRAEVEEHLDAFHTSDRQLPVLTPELVLFESDAVSKEEAIRELVDALHLTGRTEKPECMEEEIWARELTYSTGFGGGFAIPHCKSAHLTANSIVILKTRLDHPGIEWGSLDGAPVSIAILLAIRADAEGKEHMKILATLSRQIMRTEFRDRLQSESDPVALSQFILSGLPV